MSKRITIPLVLLLLAALVAYIVFGLVRQNNFYGEVSIPCSDTVELTYGRGANLLIKVKQQCGDSIRVETKSRRGEWTPLTTNQNTTLGPAVKVVNFDTNTVALVTVNSREKIRFICFNGEMDSCKVEVKNILDERAFIRATSGMAGCGNRTSTRVFNFTRNIPLVVRINWSSVCGTQSGSRFTPSKPRVFVKDNDDTRNYSEVGTVTLRGNGARMNDYILSGGPRGGKELLIECPGRDGTCNYSVSLKGR